MRRTPPCTAVLAAIATFAIAVSAQTPHTSSSESVNLNVSESGAASPDPKSQNGVAEALQPVTSVSTAGASQVRIVRLSEARGEVQLDRSTGHAFEPAFVNIPIVAGERLQTLDGLAEVEFEDNSSLRLTPKSLVEFPVLQRSATGATETVIKVMRGSAYFSLANTKGAAPITVQVGSRTITLPPSSHVRVDVTASEAKLIVLHGSAMISDASGTVAVSRKKAVTFDLASASAPVLPTHGETAPFDKWDKNSVSYHQVRASAAFAGASPYAYGVADMGYYGSFTNISGCGSLWRPYLAGASFDPYQSGVWTMYPGAGYSWVSLYPWGWTPYHSGNWEYCPGGNGASAGTWGWRPSGSWTALKNLPPVRPIHGPLRPLPPAPHPGGSSLVAVNLKGLPVSRVESAQTFTFRGDSAGMGVPRNVFGNLGRISQTVSEHGMAFAPVSVEQAQRGFIPLSATGGSAVRAAATGQSMASGASHASSSSISSAASFSSATSAASAHSASSVGSAASGAGAGAHH